MATIDNNNQQRRPKPKLKLPFTDKKSDMGEWAFDHRMGLCVTVIIYLLFAITFVSAKIFVGGEKHAQGFYVELEDIAALEELRDKLEEEVAQKQEFDWESVSNQRSNENSQEQSVKDDRGTDIKSLSDNASKAQEEMAENRKAYEEAINSIKQQREKILKESREKSSESRDIKRQGNVTVSYSFAAPVRHAQNLVVPAYQCQGGGQIVLEVRLNTKGQVIKCEVKSGVDDKCMQETALKAAKGSTFNTDPSAPDPHTGTISYIFIPQ